MRTKFVVAGAAAVALVGGCAAQQVKLLEPKLELRAAAQHLAEAKQAGFTLKVTGSADDLIAATKTTDADDVKSVRTLFNSSVTIAYDQAADGPDDDRVRLAATIDGVEGTELRVVDKVLYAKLPVPELAKKFGFGLDDVGDVRKEAPALFDGKWVSTEAKDAAGLAGQTEDAGQTVTEVRKSATNLFDGATITRDPADSKHLIVTSSTTKAYAEMKRLVTAVNKDSEGLLDEAGDPPKDRPIVVDLWIDKDHLTAAEVNIMQFIDGATGRAAVRLETTTGEQIAAPEGATKIDLPGLAGAPFGTGNARDMAEFVGVTAMDLTGENGGKPADHLKEAVAELEGTGATGRVVRSGVAEVTMGGTTACVKLPATAADDPTYTRGAC